MPARQPLPNQARPTDSWVGGSIQPRPRHGTTAAPQAPTTTRSNEQQQEKADPPASSCPGPPHHFAHGSPKPKQAPLRRIAYATRAHTHSAYGVPTPKHSSMEEKAPRTRFRLGERTRRRGLTPGGLSFVGPPARLDTPRKKPNSRNPIMEKKGGRRRGRRARASKQHAFARGLFVPRSIEGNASRRRFGRAPAAQPLLSIDQSTARAAASACRSRRRRAPSSAVARRRLRTWDGRGPPGMPMPPPPTAASRGGTRRRHPLGFSGSGRGSISPTGGRQDGLLTRDH